MRYIVYKLIKKIHFFIHRETAGEAIETEAVPTIGCFKLFIGVGHGILYVI